MKVLFVGGTGFISTAVSKMALERGLELYHLNRGQRQAPMAGVRHLRADAHQPEQVRAALGELHFDAVVDWIAFTPADIERDLDLFRGRIDQFVFISSASAYQKPPAWPIITESTPLHNPHWEYSRNKIACEERLLRAYREEGFPATIVRPSLTYDPNLPIAIGGWGCYTLADRLLKGKPIIVHGDGSSLWVVTHAEDFARGFLGLLGHGQALGQAFHITSDEVLTWNQIYQTIAQALGVEARIVHIASDFIARVSPGMYGSLLGDKTWSAVFDNSKIKAFVPEFQARIPFREGVRRTLAWFDADPARKRVDQAVNAEMDRILAAYER
ncbi:MAG: SDR family oxidoreductase [Candidatus Latescibacteria bacterium]|nr:SDR family oxidoreductase [Candidatus Latescibacterota bacterium]